MAIACLRLLTVCPDPLLSVPFFRRFIADFTRFAADFPYLAIATSLVTSANLVLMRCCAGRGRNQCHACRSFAPRNFVARDLDLRVEPIRHSPAPEAKRQATEVVRAWYGTC